jgi:putative hydrolase of the HAD superfamily
MIKAVIWDFGGVFTSSPFEAFNRYETEQGIPADFIRSVNATNPDSNAWAQFESSQVSVEEFDSIFAAETEAAGHRIPGGDVLMLLSGDIRPQMACEQLEIEPSEAVFIDDLGINLKPARAMGMTTIKVLSLQQALTELSEVLSMDLMGAAA